MRIPAYWLMLKLPSGCARAERGGRIAASAMAPAAASRTHELSRLRQLIEDPTGRVGVQDVEVRVRLERALEILLRLRTIPAAVVDQVVPESATRQRPAA